MDVGGRATHDYRDIGGRVTPGAVTEEAKAEAGIQSHNPAVQADIVIYLSATTPFFC